MFIIEDLPVPMLPCNSTVVCRPIALIRFAAWLNDSAYMLLAVVELLIVVLRVFVQHVYKWVKFVAVCLCFLLLRCLL